MKILITGAKGMLGQMLANVLGEKHELILTDREEMDIADPKAVNEVFKKNQPEIVIHAAAYVDVERAETDKVVARKVNVIGSKNIAAAAKKLGACVFYISTDYVFDGKDSRKSVAGSQSLGMKNRKPYKETDQTNPLSVYAITKYLGECEIIKNCPKHYILRVSWLFGESRTGRNFVESMVSLAKSKDEIKVINDQIGSPTYTRDIAEVISKFLDRIKNDKSAEYGVYNFSGLAETTRFGFTKEIFRQAKIKTKLSPISTKEFFASAPRPAYSYLDKSKIEKALDFKVRPWQEMLKDYFARTQ